MRSPPTFALLGSQRLAMASRNSRHPQYRSAILPWIVSGSKWAGPLAGSVPGWASGIKRSRRVIWEALMIWCRRMKADGDLSSRDGMAGCRSARTQRSADCLAIAGGALTITCCTRRAYEQRHLAVLLPAEQTASWLVGGILCLEGLGGGRCDGGVVGVVCSCSRASPYHQGAS